jgi:hypothetical protein
MIIHTESAIGPIVKKHMGRFNRVAAMKNAMAWR